MKTLAEPTLTAVSGEKATFKVGGEFNLVTNQNVDDDNRRRSTYDIEKLEYGIGLEFQPVVLSPGRISLKVRTSVSEPTTEGSVSAVGRLGGGVRPAGMTVLSIRKRLADTTVELPSGGSMMIAGLVRDDIRQAINGFPGLSKIPVLGTLFRSRDFVRNETELVIIVTPYLVRPVARNELAKPDDNFNAAERRRRHVPRPRQPRLRHHADRPAPTAAITASSATSTSDRGRADGQDQLRTTTSPHACVDRRGAGRRRDRHRCRGRHRSLLAGCATKRDSITVGAVPDDYRTNHPIVIAEKEQVLDLPVARRRPRHDANRSASRSTASSTATTGAPRRCVTITVAGRLRQRDRRGATPPATSGISCARAAFPQPRSSMTSYQAPSVDVSAPVRVVLHGDARADQQMRALAGRPAGQRPKTSTTRISAAPIRTTSPHRSPIRPICSGRASRPTIDAEKRGNVIDDYQNRASGPSLETRSRLLTAASLGARDDEQSGLRYQTTTAATPRAQRCRRDAGAAAGAAHLDPGLLRDRKRRQSDRARRRRPPHGQGASEGPYGRHRRRRSSSTSRRRRPT